MRLCIHAHISLFFETGNCGGGYGRAAVKEKRAGEAKSAAADMKAAYMRSCIGSVLPVLFETSESGKSIGHADNYCRVSVDESNLRSLVKNVQIETICEEILVGKTV